MHAIKCAKVEATASQNGIGVVKLMGRHCGFLTAFASLASTDVDICLIPESPFSIDKVVAHVRHLLQKKGHVVITIAEGTPVPSAEKKVRSTLIRFPTIYCLLSTTVAAR